MNKKIVFLVLSISFLILCPVGIYGQSLSEFNQSHTHKVTYDDNFNPTLHLTLKNVSSKTITSVEVSVDYKTDSYDWTKEPERRIVHITIKPWQLGTLNISVPKEKYYNKPQSFWISKIRFSDGTICDK